MDSIPSEASGSVLSYAVIQVLAEVGLSDLPPKNIGCWARLEFQINNT